MPLDLWYYLNYNWAMGSKIGRPRTGRKPNFSIRIDPATIKQARSAAITQKKTLGRWLEEAIAEKIGRENKLNKGSKMSAKRRELAPDKPTGECLLCGADSVSNQETASFEGGNLAWEASTLPLSYTRPNHIYFSPKFEVCKERVCSKPKQGTLANKT